MKKKMLLCAWLLGMVFCDVRITSASDTATAIASNVALGFVMNALPEKAVSNTAAFVLFLVVNGWMRQINPLVLVPSYVIGSIAGGVTKHIMSRDEHPTGRLVADYSDNGAAAADC